MVQKRKKHAITKVNGSLAGEEGSQQLVKSKKQLWELRLSIIKTGLSPSFIIHSPSTQAPSSRERLERMERPVSEENRKKKSRWQQKMARIIRNKPISSKLNNHCFPFRTVGIHFNRLSQRALDSLHELICSHEILSYVTAEAQRTSLILSQLERMEEGRWGKTGSENDERKLRDTKGVSGV